MTYVQWLATRLTIQTDPNSQAKALLEVACTGDFYYFRDSKGGRRANRPQHSPESNRNHQPKILPYASWGVAHCCVPGTVSTSKPVPSVAQWRRPRPRDRLRQLEVIQRSPACLCKVCSGEASQQHKQQRYIMHMQPFYRVSLASSGMLARRQEVCRCIPLVLQYSLSLTYLSSAERKSNRNLSSLSACWVSKPQQLPGQGRAPTGARTAQRLNSSAHTAAKGSPAGLEAAQSWVHFG